MKILENKKVVLLEGTRNVPEENQNKLTLFAAEIAKQYPNMIFRSGNASGSDELFAKGIESVDASRMEQMLPFPNSRKKYLHKDSPVLSLSDLTREEIQEVADLSIEATPSYKQLINMYMKEFKKNRVTIKAIYLLRDALKVTGLKRLNYAPADIGIFYKSVNKPLGGGTGHTIRMCELRNIPVLGQDDWMK